MNNIAFTVTVCDVEKQVYSILLHMCLYRIIWYRQYMENCLKFCTDLIAVVAKAANMFSITVVYSIYDKLLPCLTS